MSSPPSISHDALPSTPDKGWAVRTTVSLSPEPGTNLPSRFDGGNKEYIASAASTPGPEFPGAYPGGFEASDTVAPGNAKNVAIGVLHTAQKFIPTQHDVEKAMLSASETARQYLPYAVASYLPSSPNDSNTKASSAEVDDLAEGDGGKGVAKLPDEHDDYFAQHVPNGIDSTPLTPGTHADSPQTSEWSSNLSTHAQAGSVTTSGSPLTMPIPPTRSSLDTPTSENGTGGNGLSSSTFQHAPLPNNGLESLDMAQGVHLGKGRDIEGNKLSKNGTPNPQQPLPNTIPRIYPLAKQGAKWKGVSLSESAESSELENGPSTGVNGHHETPVKIDTQSATTRHPAPSIELATTSDAGRERVGSTSSTTSGSSRDGSKIRSNVPGGSPHRSKFMDKIKGEVKVISGKLAHNEEKVEEGRRLMGKAA